MELIGRKCYAVTEEKDGNKPTSIGELVNLEFTPLGDFAEILWTEGEQAGNHESIHLKALKYGTEYLGDIGIYV